MSPALSDIDFYILCGGFGKRLRIVSGNTPKPMMEFGKVPFLDILIKCLAKTGAKRIILGIGYKAQDIRKYYTSNKIPGCKILFSQENTPLGTGGAVKKAKRLIKSDPFFVLNGDSFCDFRPKDFLKFHKAKRAVASILLRKVPIGSEYGSVRLNRAGRILDFNEKDSSARNCLVNAGVYLFDKKVFGLMPRKNVFSLEKDLFPELISKNCFGCVGSGSFIDIGTPDRYLKAKAYFFKNKKWKRLIS